MQPMHDANAISVYLLWWSQHMPTLLAHALAHTATDTPTHVSAMLLYESLYTPLHIRCIYPKLIPARDPAAPLQAY